MTQDGIERGIITRIYVKNFVTYDEVIIRPGRNLNLIIGPNGTGKSTIVCAIALGLGGKTSIIGRATHIGEYVKNGQKNAIIEIDLQSERNKCLRIRRCFDVNGHSTWNVNSQSANAKQIGDLMKAFNIQIDNLCQFLPQEKVQDFANYKAPELLKETERSVGDPILIKHHDKLIELRKKQAEFESELENYTKSFATQKQIYESLKDKVGHINEQKQIKKKLKSLKQKRGWMLYQNKREELVKAKTGRDEAALHMKKMEKKLEPVKKKLDKLKASIQNIEKTAKQHLTETNTKRNKLIRFADDVEMQEKSIAEVEAQCQEDIKTEQERDERIDQFIEEKNKMENDITQLINNVGQIEGINQQLGTVNMEINQQRKILDDQKDDENFYKQQINHVNRKISADEHSLQEVYDIANKRLETLRRLSKDSYEGVLWLRANKQLFSKPIHEPIILNINLKDPSYSKYFENTIPLRDLTAFVCEDKNDMNLLIKYLRGEQRLVVNAVYSDPDKNVDDSPRIPLEHIRQFGFEHYLVSLIEAPKTVMNYLITMHNLHNIPIGSNKVATSLDKIPHELYRFFSNTHSFSISFSKYSNERSTRQAAISSRDILAITIDHNKIQRIEQEINDSRKKINALTNELQKSKEAVGTVSKKIEDLKTNRNKLQTNKSKIDNLNLRMKLIDQSIEKEHKNRKNVEDIHTEYKNKIQNIIKQQLNIFQSYNSLHEECFKSIIMDEEMKLQIKLKKNEQAIIDNETQDLQTQLAEAERNYKALDKELNPLKMEVKNLFEAAIELTDGLCYGKPEFDPFKSVFAKLPATVDELFTEIQATQAKIFSLNNDQSEAARVLQNFNEAKKKMENFDEGIKKKEEELTKVTEEISRTKEEWYPVLSKLVDKINENFSESFKKMKCAGEVSLCQGDNPMDFEKYGLKIRVKFRDSGDLQVLTRNHQSGGERAVTTAIYMIALQELTRVPFRCVDEINQGMDATNERKVFELIVNKTSNTTSAQYFLLTPKLLPNLKYNETVTVLTVCNGKYMIPSSKLDITGDCDNFVEAIKRRNTQDQS